MSFQGGVSVANGSSMEEPGDENRNHETRTTCSKALRTRLKSTDPALEGRSSNMEQLVRPPLPGRKAHRKTGTEGNRGRWREGNPGRNEDRQRTEHLGAKERERQRLRKVERAETHDERAQEKQERGSTDSLSSSNSDVQLSSISEAGERSNNSQRGHAYPKPQGIGFTRTTTTNLNFQSTRPAIQSRSTPLSPQRLPSRPAAGNTHSYSFNARDTDPFWVEVITGAASEQSSPNHQSQTHNPHATTSEPEEDEDEGNAEDEEEEGSGVVEVMSQAIPTGILLPSVPFGDMRMSKREKNRIKSLRKRQRRREKWRQSQQQDSRQSSTGNPTTTSSSSSSEDDEAVSMRDKEGFICAVCLDVYFSPYMCHPCNHIFCEPCLRTLAKNSPTNTPCPLCRTIITHVFFQKELNQTARTFFPKEYLSRKQIFQKASCAKWPLPSCRKLFRIFGGFQRQPTPITRRQFPHGGGYRLETMDFEDDSRGWRFDMDMVIIYIYSVNWIIGFFIFCFLCYIFFPSF
ncbi:E3 ubiquitin-protein ligase RNF180 isoform X2 [Cololabis saira]|uniref:E3 ubiquitin-protein ligase RNF180 isoform X2 n=1 Tax=Cololabis saira TaxID=129043 RepID=UPI002AD5701F|nr:E3 ubiquitin-protein ligase RNF180 isoform X2 [Cololabis saira]